MEEERRLSDKIIIAHELACEEGKLEVADILLRALEVDLSAIGGSQDEQRMSTEAMEAAEAKQVKVRKDTWKIGRR